MPSPHHPARSPYVSAKALAIAIDTRPAPAQLSGALRLLMIGASAVTLWTAVIVALAALVR